MPPARAGVVYPRMVRWALIAAAAVVVLAAVETVVARMLGARVARVSSLVAVIVQWLAAYVLWTFAGGLAMHAGLVTVYQPALFLVLALVAGVWHYRARVALNRERARVIFIAGQLVWLVILLVQNGALGDFRR